MTTHRQKSYQVVPFPSIRLPTVDSMRISRRKPAIHALAEMDVTVARESLAAYKRATGQSLSFTGFIIACLAKAVEEHKIVQAYRQGWRRLVLFDDVDVCTIVEHDLHDPRHDKQATPHVIRAANRKTLRAIHQEIRNAQATGVSYARGRPFYPYVPLPLRYAFWWAFHRSPSLRKRIAGTVAVTALGMFGTGSAWGIPIAEYTLVITSGGIVEKPGVVDGRVAVRQYLCLTVTADHNIVDGAPLARFLQRFKVLVESGYGLEDASVPLIHQEATPAALGQLS